ncbi:MAG: WD40 repeat domain-containing protein [Anaerolineaceae bacterium]
MTPQNPKAKDHPNFDSPPASASSAAENAESQALNDLAARLTTFDLSSQSQRKSALRRAWLEKGSTPKKRAPLGWLPALAGWGARSVAVILLILVAVIGGVLLYRNALDHATPLSQPQTTPTTARSTATPVGVQVLTPYPVSNLAITTENFDQVVEVSRIGKGAIQNIQNVNGSLAISSPLGLTLYDSDYREQSTFVAPYGENYTATYSPDGSLLAVGINDTVTIYRAADLSFYLSLTGQPGTVRRVMFSADGKMLASLVRPPGAEVYNYWVEIWDLSSGMRLGSWNLGANNLPPLWSADGSRMVAWNPIRMDALYVYRVPSGELEAQIKDVRAQALALSPDGSLLAVAVDAQSVELIHLPDGTVLQTLDLGAQALVDAQRSLPTLAFSAQGEVLYIMSNQLASFWSVSDGRWIYSYGLPDSYQALKTYAPDWIINKLMPISGGSLPDDPGLNALLSEYAPPVQNALLLGDARQILILHGPNLEIAPLELRSIAGVETFFSQKVSAISLALSPDEQTAALGMWDGTVELVDAHSGELLQTFSQHSEQVQSVAFDPRGGRLASSTMEQIKIWNLDAGSERITLHQSGGWVDEIAYSPDGSLLAAHSANAGITVWNTQTDQPVYNLAFDSQGWQGSLVFSPDSQILFAAGAQTLQAWDLTNGEVLFQKRYTATITCLAISADGSLLAAGTAQVRDSGVAEGTIQWLRSDDGEVLGTMQGHRAAVNSIAFSRDGRYLVSGGDDGAVLIWGVK